MTEIYTREGGQKDAFLRKANVLKNSLVRKWCQNNLTIHLCLDGKKNNIVHHCIIEKINLVCGLIRNLCIRLEG